MQLQSNNTKVAVVCRQIKPKGISRANTNTLHNPHSPAKIDLSMVDYRISGYRVLIDANYASTSARKKPVTICIYEIRFID